MINRHYMYPQILDCPEWNDCETIGADFDEGFMGEAVSLDGVKVGHLVGGKIEQDYRGMTLTLEAKVEKVDEENIKDFLRMANIMKR